MILKELGDIPANVNVFTPAYDTGCGLNFILFRCGDALMLQLFTDRRVFVDYIYKGQVAGTHTGTCSPEEFDYLVNLYWDGLDDED